MESEIAHTVSLEEAMELNPVGFFQYRLLLMCGLTFMTDALEVTLLSFLTTCAAAEWNLTTTEQATLTAIVFLGIVVGSMFWGWFADTYGRRPAYLYSCVLITAGGLLSAVAPSYTLLTILRAITGFGIGGASVPFDLLAEFMPASHRGPFLVLTELFWTFGSMFVAGMAWMTLSTLGWRFLAFVCAVPVCAVSVLGYFCLPESPRWLLSKHREREANLIIHNAALVNNVILSPFVINSDFSKNTTESSYMDLVRTKEARKVVIPLWLIWGLFGFTYYGLILFVSRIYSKREDDGVSNDATAQCAFDYAPIFYNAASESFAILMSAALIDRIGRIQSQSFFYALGGVAVICVGLEISPVAILFFSILARICAMSSTVSDVHSSMLP
jgi:MFS family permease